MKVAILEDDAVVREVLEVFTKQILPDAKFETHATFPGDEWCRTTDVDIIVTDCLLGSVLLCEQACMAQANKPTLVVTGDTTLHCPYDNCVVLYKPFTFTAFSKALDEVLAIWRNSYENCSD